MVRCLTTTNGWTKSSVFVHWLRECLIPQLNDLREPGELALLIFDGHSSHDSDEADQLAKENNIHFAQLPSHTTHKLQPLDVGVFGPMQAAWRKQCKSYTLKTSSEMPLAQVVKEYLEARTRVMKESNITSAWKKSGLLSLDPHSFSADDYGPSQLTSTNAFLPPSYSQTVPPDIDANPGSDTASESSVDPPWTPHSSDDESTDDPAQPTAGPSHFSGSHGGPSRSPTPHPTPAADRSSRSTRFHTPPPFLESDGPHHLSQRQSASRPHQVPSLDLTPRRTRSHGLFTPLPPGLPKKDRRFTDRRPIEQKYQDSLDENEKLRGQIEVLNNNQAKLENLLEAAQADCHFARQHIMALQAEHNAKKEGKQKRNSTKAEWLTSEANRKKRAEEKVERERKEAEENVAKEKKEADARERQGLRNQWAMSGRFTGLVVGKKKDDLKDIAQALCLEVGGTNQELADRINRCLDTSPALQSDERFKGLFAARTKKASDLKKRKMPTPATPAEGQDGGRDVIPPSQKPRLH